jgi:hypothetical protein
MERGVQSAESQLTVRAAATAPGAGGVVDDGTKLPFKEQVSVEAWGSNMSNMSNMSNSSNSSNSSFRLETGNWVSRMPGSHTHIISRSTPRFLHPRSNGATVQRCNGATVQRYILPLCSYAVAPLRRCTVTPLRRCAVAPLRRCAVASSHRGAVALTRSTATRHRLAHRLALLSRINFHSADKSTPQVNGYAKKFAGTIFRNEEEKKFGEAKLEGNA